ncbi:MAG: PAS domain S-box protein [Chloroflexi bacterium]|nr:PAS domain S-box protein [Chloroflexota bacterium]
MVKIRLLFILNMLGISLLPCLPPAHAVQEPERPHILILNSYHHGFLWSDDEIRGVVETLPEDAIVDIEHMDTKRFTGEAYLAQYATIFAEKFGDDSFDIIITLDDNAFRFMQQHHARFFPQTPVVFGGVNHLEPGDLANFELFTGVVEQIDYLGTIQTALALHPDTERILVITDATTSSQVNRGKIEALVANDQIPVEVEFLDDGSGLDFETLRDMLSQAPDNSVVYYSDFYQDRDGNPVHYNDVLPQLAAISNAPIYVHNDFYLGYGATGGQVVNGYYHGMAIGQIVNRVLAGERPSQISVPTGPLVYMFDYDQLKHWGISTKDLPADSLIVNEPDPSFYERYREIVWATGLFTVLQTTLIAYLIVNIMSRRKAVQTLQRSEAQYRSMVEASPLPIMIHAGGKYVFLNQAACEVLGGKTRDDFIGKPVKEVIHSDYWAQADVRISQIYTGTPYAPLVEQRFTRLDGEDIDVLVTATRIEFEGALASQVVFSDITARKQAEHDRFELAVERERVNMLRRFIADASHDLRTPLATITTSIYLLRHRLPNLTDSEHRQIRILEVQAKRLSRMVDDMLHMSRLDATEHFVAAPVDLNPLVKDIVHGQQDLARQKNLQLQFRAFEQPCLVEANDLMLSRAIANLVENAIHYTPAGGQVTVRTVRTDGSVMCEVQDSGTGIPAEDLPHIFDRFFRGDRARQTNEGGSGLGLAIVQKVVALHGGNIQVESEMEHGSVFRVRLPAQDGTYEPGVPV